MTILISARTLATTLDVIGPFASKDQTVPSYLRGIHFRPHKRGVEVWATDRYRAAALQVPLDNAAEFDPFTLSTAAGGTLFGYTVPGPNNKYASKAAGSGSAVVRIAQV